MSVHSSNAALVWGIKESFVKYVTMTGGLAEVSAPAAAEGAAFVFPLADASEFDVPTARGVLRFGGSVHFAGHFGALDLTLAEPWLESDEQGAVISLDAQGFGRTPVVALGPAETAIEDGLIVWAGVEARMMAEAALLFNGVYGKGERFDDVTVRIPLR